MSGEGRDAVAVRGVWGALKAARDAAGACSAAMSSASVGTADKAGTTAGALSRSCATRPACPCVSGNVAELEP